MVEERPFDWEMLCGARLDECAKRIFFRNKEVSFEENAGFFLTAEFFFIWWWLSGFAVRFKCYKDLLDIRLGACSLTIVKLCKPG